MERIYDHTCIYAIFYIPAKTLSSEWIAQLVNWCKTKLVWIACFDFKFQSNVIVSQHTSYIMRNLSTPIKYNSAKEPKSWKSYWIYGKNDSVW